ncbi:MAG TPA: alpha/beta hydrolase [Herpetosiphonaceae bacterium]|nr:alpha/beta hydrolase [Herpetosiphonaceae bacterium]
MTMHGGEQIEQTAQDGQGGYAPVNGLNLYYEIYGSGRPLLLLHGGFGLTGMFGEVLSQLAAGRRVIAVDLQGHGRTADLDRPLRLELMAEDIAALIAHLQLGQADIMGYSMGGAVALRTAIQHPQVVRKLVVVSTPHKRAAWYPDMVAAMEQMSAATAPFLLETPMYHAYAAVAPDPGHFPVLVDKMGDMLRQDYDWSGEVAALTVPTMLVFGARTACRPGRPRSFSHCWAVGSATAAGIAPE